MTDRELMQQALEALSPWAGEDANHTEQYAAYHAIREALAEQPAQHKPLSEPEERKAFEMYWQAKHDNRRYCESAFEGWKARATPQPAQQEPVAWLSEGGNFSFEPWQRSIPLYTSPPAQRTWVGLSTSDLDEIEAQICERGHATIAEIYRAIEAKLKEKNT